MRGISLYIESPSYIFNVADNATLDVIPFELS